MKTALLIMTYGSPLDYSFEGVGAFYTNIRDGVRPSKDEIDTLYKKYQLIGKSPLQEITKETASLLEERLDGEIRVYYANKFSSPRIFETIEKMEEDGIRKCLCIILEPYYSMYSVMGYERFIKSDKIEFNIIQSWHRQESLIKYWAEELVGRVKEVCQREYEVVFTAHSVPKIAEEMQDPYIKQVCETVASIVEKMDIDSLPYRLVWQSESENGMEWIEPDVLKYLDENGKTDVEYIFAPIGFISDHIEILYDIDVECRKKCEALGANFSRISMPNNDERLLQSLINLVKLNIDGEYKIYSEEDENMEDVAAVQEDVEKLKMPYFVKKLIEKKGKENVKMPEYVRKMLIKAGKIKE